MWSPLRARKLKKNGTLMPFVPFKTFETLKLLIVIVTPKGMYFRRYVSFSGKTKMLNRDG